jgi:hypothetical protein
VGTGLIFAAVVIAWAVFLVPWALRRYDEATRARSVERFSSAMRVLRRPNRMDESEPETEPAATPPSLRARPTEATTVPAAEPPRPSRAAARAAAQRRRRVLLTLLTVTFGTGILAVVAVLPGWAVATPAALVVCFLALCRWQVRREDDAIWARRRAAPDHEHDASAESTAPAGDEPNDEPTVVLRRASAKARDGEPGRHATEADAAPVDAADLAEPTSVAVTVPTDDGNSLWDPLPVTLPTYVSKAKATRTVRTIDLGQPDTWTSGHVEGERTEMPSDASGSGSDASAGESDDHRPAVGD